MVFSNAGHVHIHVFSPRIPSVQGWCQHSVKRITHTQYFLVFSFAFHLYNCGSKRKKMQDILLGQACQAGAEYIKHRHYLKHLALNLRELCGGEISACREKPILVAPASLSTPARLRYAEHEQACYRGQRIKQLSFPPWLYQLHRTCRKLLKPMFPGQFPSPLCSPSSFEVVGECAFHRIHHATS